MTKLNKAQVKKAKKVNELIVSWLQRGISLEKIAACLRDQMGVPYSLQNGVLAVSLSVQKTSRGGYTYTGRSEFIGLYIAS